MIIIRIIINFITIFTIFMIFTIFFIFIFFIFVAILFRDNINLARWFYVDIFQNIYLFFFIH